MKIKLKLILVLLSTIIISTTATSNENSKGLNFYTGMFDFSDDGKRAALYGVEHQNENLYRDTFFGRISPITGLMITQDKATYLYTGIEANYSLVILNITPSFTPGYYRQGDGKDLGHPLEFKSEVKVGLDIFENSKLSYSYSHISNNDWGDTNPGTDNQQITFSKNF